MDYAAGSLAEAPALLVATHLALCPECRHRVSAFEALGGVLLEELSPAPLGAEALDAVLARLDDPAALEPPPRTPRATVTAAPATPPRPAPLLPEPLRSYAGGDPDTIAWRRVIGGIEEHVLPVARTDFKACLYRIAPGVVVPRHTHGRSEMLLVLEGAVRDRGMRFGRGDVSFADGGIDHSPAAEPERPCICLAVLDGPLRLTGPIGRWLNRFVKL